MFAEFINTYGAEILYTAITAIFGYIAIVAKNMYKKYADNQTKKDVVHTVVQGVEQLYKDLHGEEKLEVAYEFAIDMLEEKGISVSGLELRMLIESAVGSFNGVFWKVEADEPDPAPEKESETVSEEVE